MKLQCTCVVTGLVQGVGFRWFVHRQAAGLGLTGWARNNRDGSVEVLAQGPKDRIEELIISLRNGPRSAMVQDVKVEWAPSTQELSSFEIR